MTDERNRKNKKQTEKEGGGKRVSRSMHMQPQHRQSQQWIMQKLPLTPQVPNTGPGILPVVHIHVIGTLHKSPCHSGIRNS